MEYRQITRRGVYYFVRMHNNSPILVFGNDITLLETRRLVLERGGYQIYIAADLQAVENIATSEPLALLVLCHTLTPAEGQAAIATTLALRPEVKKLLLTISPGAHPNSEDFEVLNALAGPRELISTVDRLLS
jgi:hypothetical protein